MKAIVSLLICSVMLFGLAACGSSPTPTPQPTARPHLPSPTSAAQARGPIVIINSPASNSEFAEGEQVTINSTSSSSVGIVLVELIVNGRLVQSSPTPNNQPQVQFSVLQTWQAIAGEQKVIVRATDARANTADASIIVRVSGAVIPTAAPLPTDALPTPISPETPIAATPTGAPQPTCSLNSRFIADVTIPDGTQMAPNSPFVKTWQIQNNGSCNWDANFQLVFVSGAQMFAPSPSPIPPTPAGAVTNLSLNMIAPSQPGRYQSVWQLQASNGALFGTRIDVIIIVPGAVTPIPPTPPPSVCNGSPQISSFFANPSTIQEGQVSTLSWGPVTNATNVVLQSPQGNSGVATPGQIQVQPGGTTTYTLIAYCYNNAVQVQATVNVRQVRPTPIPPTPPPAPNQIRRIQVSKSGTTYTVTINYYWTGEDAPAVMRAVGINNDATPVTDYGESSIVAGHVRNVTFSLTGKKVAEIVACIIGRGGNDLICSNQVVR